METRNASGRAGAVERAREAKGVSVFRGSGQIDEGESRKQKTERWTGPRDNGTTGPPMTRVGKKLEEAAWRASILKLGLFSVFIETDAP